MTSPLADPRTNPWWNQSLIVEAADGGQVSLVEFRFCLRSWMGARAALLDLKSFVVTGIPRKEWDQLLGKPWHFGSGSLFWCHSRLSDGDFPARAAEVSSLL